MLKNIVTKVFGTADEREIKKMRKERILIEYLLVCDVK